MMLHPTRTPIHRRWPWAVLAVLSLAAGAAAQAQTFKDPALEGLYVAERIDELLRVSTARLAEQADDAQAVLGVALAALARNDGAARLSAIRHAQACIQKQARAAPCQYALGAVTGIQAMSEGLFKMARSAGTVKDALTLAHTLEPGWYTARSALVEFYLAAPGLMGGSASKAAELARQAPQPGQVKALEGRVALANKQYEAAIQSLFALPPGTDAAAVSDARGWAVQAGMGLVNTGQAARAQALFERMVREQADTSGPFYGLARARGELGAHEDALKLYEQAQNLKGAGQWPLQYRIGMSLQQLGRNDEARLAYKRFIEAGKGPFTLIDDAKRRLDSLGG